MALVSGLMRRRTFLLPMLLLLTACGSGGVEPRVIEGLADANTDGTVIWLTEAGSDDNGEGYIVAGADFKQADGTSRQGGSATCIEPGATRQPVQLGLVKVDGGKDFGTREHVVWVHCLG